MFKRLIRFTRRWCRRWVQVFLREATHCSLELHRNAAAKVRREKKHQMGRKWGRVFFSFGQIFFAATRYELQCFVAILVGMTLSTTVVSWKLGPSKQAPMLIKAGSRREVDLLGIWSKLKRRWDLLEVMYCKWSFPRSILNWLQWLSCLSPLCLYVYVSLSLQTKMRGKSLLGSSFACLGPTFYLIS